MCQYGELSRSGRAGISGCSGTRLENLELKRSSSALSESAGRPAGAVSVHYRARPAAGSPAREILAPGNGGAGGRAGSLSGSSDPPATRPSDSGARGGRSGMEWSRLQYRPTGMACRHVPVRIRRDWGQRYWLVGRIAVFGVLMSYPRAGL